MVMYCCKPAAAALRVPTAADPGEVATLQGANRVGLSPINTRLVNSPIYGFYSPKSDAELGPTWMIQENTRYGGDGANERHPLEWDGASDFNGNTFI